MREQVATVASYKTDSKPFFFSIGLSYPVADERMWPQLKWTTLSLIIFYLATPPGRLDN